MPAWNHWNQRLYQASLKALESAYQGAIAIKSMEDQHFGGQAIHTHPEKGKTVSDYFQTQLERQLLNVRSSLTRFRMTAFLVNHAAVADPSKSSGEPSPTESIILEKLDFIEAVVGKYRDRPNLLDALTEAPVEAVAVTAKGEEAPVQAVIITAEPLTPSVNGAIRNVARGQRKRSLPFWGSGAIAAELDPKYEQQVLQDLRLRRAQTKIAVRWLLILLLIPLLVQMVTKNAILNPLFGTYSDRYPTKVELSREIQENFLHEFSIVKEEMEVAQLLEVIPHLTPEEEEERLHEKAVELWRESREEALNGRKNVVADLIALGAFAGLVFLGRNQLSILRGFTNRTFLNLSDPAKVFLFILITDMFVGFHSAEGWEVILESALHHVGLPENKVLINGFIATVPVVVDSCIKFWIFSYLTRYSPSSSAIYERMNT